MNAPTADQAIAYGITAHGDCFEVTFGGRHLSAVGTYAEAQDYIGQCQEHDVAVEREKADMAHLMGQRA